MYFTLSSALARIPNLDRLLDGEVHLGWPRIRNETTAMLGWGRKPSYRRAEAYAAKRGLRCISLEDGFLRSIGLGRDDPPLSIVVDDLGIYYAADTPSRLEALIAVPHSVAQHARARALAAQWRASRVSKYNQAREAATLPAEPYVLVADQTWGDASIRYGQADASSFRRMLEAAVEENPGCTIMLKVHPEVMAGRKRGHFDPAELARLPRVQVLGQDVHPVSLLEHAAAIYAVTSQLGFEGLLWGKRVRTFGMPFYAGWGLTQDDAQAPARRKPVALEDLLHAALVDYPRYLDPETGQRCEPERLIEWLGLQRSMRERFPSQIYALGFSLWKRPIVRAFFQGSDVRFLRNAHAVPQHGVRVVWGNAQHEAAALHPGNAAAETGKLVHLEDGFLRSVGLGADLVRPLSWVMDGRGIYYDATHPSDLEHLLQAHQFDDRLLRRAKALRQRIVEQGLTKYNVSGGRWQRPAKSSRVILVPGQVETDASIAFGAGDIRTNIDLLRAVRAAHPDAHLVYKPHPDVVAGLRKRGAGENEVASWCDEVVTDCTMDALLEVVDEVHVLTSLTGFEALLRGKKVAVYGRPFYAGWGLTEDRGGVARRSRKLGLDELVAGVLILYPTYVSRTTGRYTTPERALDELLAWRRAVPPSLPLWRRLLRLGLAVAKN